MEFSEYLVKEQGKPVLLPAFCITLFTNIVVNREKSPKSLLKPYHKILQDFGKSFSWSSYGFEQKRPRAITKEILEGPERWLANSNSRSKDCAYIKLYGGKSSQDLELPFFHWDYTNYYKAGNYYSHYNLELPLSWKNNLSAEDIDNYIYQLVEGYPLVCGYAGYTVSDSQRIIITRDDLKDLIYQWHQRHPGLMNTYPISESKIIAQNDILFSIGWITILGNSLCARLGGIDELYYKLSHVSGVVVKRLPQNGVLIRIGEKPQLGDTHKDDFLDSYSAVGRILAPVAIQDFDELAKRIVVTGFQDNKECANWLGRFFREK